MNIASRVRTTTSPHGRLPDFLVIGATKCGTTALHDWLGRHPQVFIHPWKEMRFFLDEGRWDKGPDWYRRQFAQAGPNQICGEASNGYARGTEHPGVPHRIAELMPDVRLIYVVRDPIVRLASHYRHRLVTGRETRAPDVAVRSDPGYVETGRYGAELARWLTVFDRSQILVLRAERLFSDPEPQLSRIADHLDIATAPDIPFRTKNASSRRVAMPVTVRQAAQALGAQILIKSLSRTLQGLPIWRDRPSVSTVSFDLSVDLMQDLTQIYKCDGRLLNELVGEPLADWAG